MPHDNPPEPRPEPPAPPQQPGPHRAFGEPNRYEYLSAEDSALYDRFRDDPDERAKIICSLISEKAAASRQAHRLSTY